MSRIADQLLDTVLLLDGNVDEQVGQVVVGILNGTWRLTLDGSGEWGVIVAERPGTRGVVPSNAPDSRDAVDATRARTDPMISRAHDEPVSPLAGDVVSPLLDASNVVRAGPEQQLRLPVARSSDPPTSHVALTAKQASRCEGAVLAVFDSGAQLIDDELVRLLPDWYGPTVRSARSRLSKKGLLVDVGLLRLTERGRPAIVWSRPW